MITRTEKILAQSIGSQVFTGKIVCEDLRDLAHLTPNHGYCNIEYYRKRQPSIIWHVATFQAKAQDGIYEKHITGSTWLPHRNTRALTKTF